MLWELLRDIAGKFDPHRPEAADKKDDGDGEKSASGDRLTNARRTLEELLDATRKRSLKRWFGHISRASVLESIRKGPNAAADNASKSGPSRNRSQHDTLHVSAPDQPPVAGDIQEVPCSPDRDLNPDRRSWSFLSMSNPPSPELRPRNSEETVSGSMEGLAEAAVAAEAQPDGGVPGIIDRVANALSKYVFVPLRTRLNRGELLQRLSVAKTYEEWYHIAVQLDTLEGAEAWKADESCPYYDHELISQRLAHLRWLFVSKDIRSLVYCLRGGLDRNQGGLGNTNLYRHSRVGTKHLIEDYVNVVSWLIKFLAQTDLPEFSTHEKMRIMKQTRQAYGRSALLLSGGGALGMYHLGVIKVLHENNLLPNIIAGSSAGSLVASVLGTLTDDELPRMFEPNFYDVEFFSSDEAYRRRVKRLVQEGYFFDIKKLQTHLRDLIGDVTFAEAYERTGRKVNITVTSSQSNVKPFLMNYLTSPNVVIWSAACASCALPGLFEPVELVAKDEQGRLRPFHPSEMKWIDGSVETDLPTQRVAELFNVNHFIVSQVNPHVLWEKGIFNSLPVRFMKSELRHRFVQLSELGLLPKWMARFTPVLTQKYDGDITIVPIMNSEDYARVFSNPSKDMILHCLQRGEQATWAKLSMIRDHCLIEMALDESVELLRARLGHERHIPGHGHRHRSRNTSLSDDDDDIRIERSATPSRPPRSCVLSRCPSCLMTLPSRSQNPQSPLGNHSTTTSPNHLDLPESATAGSGMQRLSSQCSLCSDEVPPMIRSMDASLASAIADTTLAVDADGASSGDELRPTHA